MKSKKTLNKTHPLLCNEWDYLRNNLSSEHVTFGSTKKVWWVCKKCGYGWESTIQNRTNKERPRGCPSCAGKVVSNKNRLSCTHKYLLNEWDYIKNEVLPNNVSYGSSINVWWKCKKCGSSWKTPLCKRTGRFPTGCPTCSQELRVKSVIKNKIKEQGSFSDIYPELASEWDCIKNNKGPEEVTCYSKQKVWWVCSTCACEWKAFVFNRTIQGTGCPSCVHGNISKISQKWLDSLNVQFREYRININGTYIKVDGYDPGTNTVYEFLGDYWHGNPEVYNLLEINRSNKKLFKELYDKTFNRFRLLEKAGYKVVYIWEKDFRRLIYGKEKEG